MECFSKTEQKLKKLPYVLAFVIPLAVMSFLCIKRGIYPFGENCFLHIDMYHQYAPFFMEFLNKLKAQESLMYSWNLGIGSDFVATYAYYLASPFNWLLIFCPQEHVIEFMTILVILKIAGSGLTFAIYLGKHFKTDSYLITLVSLFYALSAFMAAYSWNIMWLDCIMLAPLIILALERLVYEKKCYLYCALLALAIVSNFYISIMICIFLVCYFFVMQFELTQNVAFRANRMEERKRYRKEVFWYRIRNMADFFFYSLLAGALGAVLLIPEAIALGYSGSGGIAFPQNMEWYFSVMDELARHCMGISVYTGRDHLPNLYCGAAVLLLFVLYLLNQNISWKKKAVRFLAIVFFLVSFANNWLDFIWHGLHFPDSLPGRQAFLYIFVLLVLCFQTLKNYSGNRLWHIVLAVVLSGVFLVLCMVFTNENSISRNAVFLTAVLLFAYTLLLLMARYKEGFDKRYLYGLAFFLCISEVTLNMDLTGVSTTSRTEYTKNLEAYQELTAEENGGFYRTEKWERMTKNESCLSGYASASLFSSLMNYSVGTFYRELGMEGGKNFYCYNGATPLLSSMLSVKYMLLNSPAEESPLRKLAGEKNGIYLYENNYVLPLGFMVPADLEENWNFRDGTAVYAQNALARALGADGDLLTSLMIQQDEQGEVIYVPENAYIYAAYSNNAANKIEADIGGKKRTFVKCSHMYLLDLGWCEAGTKIRLSSPEVQSLGLQAYQLNLDSLNQAYQTLREQEFVVDSFSDTKVTGHITVTKPGKLAFSIPCEDGWTLLVDGKETEKQTFLDGLIAISLSEGEHKIELSYVTPGFQEGAVISGVAFLLFLLIIIKHYVKSFDFFKNSLESKR